MAGHRTTIVPAANGQWQGQCSCRARSKITPDHWEAQKWILLHEQVIRQIKVHQGSRTPSLKDQRDYYRERSHDIALPADQRALWDQLATELDRRLNDQVEANDPTLF